MPGEGDEHVSADSINKIREYTSAPIQVGYTGHGDERNYIATVQIHDNGATLHGKGGTAQAAAYRLIEKLQDGRAVKGAIAAQDQEAEAMMARLGIPSEPMPPRCTPDNPCPEFDDRHAALFDVCYHEGPSPT